ncbi:MAG: NAD-dependent epimerase/dehydratase family protein [Chitinophagaceae bacterium]|nr:MAG: NAD-dependent epimerase/dehydratase family protein [Chitinophagaceae bacterium]
MAEKLEKNKTTLSILGCGWYGLPMAKTLVKKGYTVKGSTTTTSKLQKLEEAGIDAHLIDFDNSALSDEFFKCDVLLIAIPPRVNKPDALTYAQKVSLITEKALQHHVKNVMLISSTGIYPDDNFVVDETAIPIPNTPAGTALLEAENILKSINGFTSTIIRFAGLIGPERHLAKHFAGKADIANGLAPINLIHLEDCIGLTLTIIEKEQFGHTYHGVSPSHRTREDFYTKACIASGLAKPSFLKEKKNWKQIESKNVPEVLAYEYVFTNWDKYFEMLTSV